MSVSRHQLSLSLVFMLHSCNPLAPERWPLKVQACCRTARELAHRLESGLHTQSHAQLAMLTSLGSLCVAEGSTHAVWSDLAQHTLSKLGNDPGVPFRQVTYAVLGLEVQLLSRKRCPEVPKGNDKYCQACAWLRAAPTLCGATWRSTPSASWAMIQVWPFMKAQACCVKL